MSKYGMWQGTPRERIPWFPTIDEAKCKGCKECFKFCKHEVYTWDDTAKKPRVANPFGCVVGCSNCAGQCKEQAIVFPPLTILQAFLK